MVGKVLLVVGQTEAVDVVGKGAEALAEGERDVGTAQLRVTHHIVDLQVRIQESTLVAHVGLNLDGSLVDEFFLIRMIISGRRRVRLNGGVGLGTGEDGLAPPHEPRLSSGPPATWPARHSPS